MTSPGSYSALIPLVVPPWRTRLGWRWGLNRTPQWFRRVWWALGLPGWSPSRYTHELWLHVLDELRAELDGGDP